MSATDVSESLLSELEQIGVRLLSNRPQVRDKVAAAVAHRRLDASASDPHVELVGPDWPEDLAEVLEELTPSERAELYATFLAPDPENRSPVPIRAERALERARSPWFPKLLSSDGLFPHFQPILKLKDGSVHGRESLIRGRLGDRILTGGEILTAAMAHGALFDLDMRARSVALEHGVPLLPGGEVLFVNFDPSAVYDPDASLRATRAVARRLEFPLERVCFEVAQTEAFADSWFLYRILDAYRANGALVALDDLGGDSASLNSLRQLRPDYVKVDMRLVYGIDMDPARQRLVGALIDYAHELEICVVAEGIETEAELTVIRELGADLGQGWYIGRPEEVPAEVDPKLVTGASSRA